MNNNDPAAAAGTSFEVRLSREMRLFDIVMIGVGAMIGAGIFVLTGIAAGVAGPGLLLAFLLNGVVTLFAAAPTPNWVPPSTMPAAATCGSSSGCRTRRDS